MAENPCFTYWTVECKTKDCGLLVLALIRPCRMGRIPFLERCEDFELTCKTCSRVHLYTQMDVSWKDLDQAPPRGYKGAPEFLAATQMEPRQGCEGQ